MIDSNKIKANGQFIKMISEGLTVDMWIFKTSNSGSFVLGVHKSFKIKKGMSYNIVFSIYLRTKPNSLGKPFYHNAETLIDMTESPTGKVS